MFRFEHISYLWGLTAIPLMIIVFIWLRLWRKTALKKFGEASIVKKMMPGVSTIKPVIKLAFLCLAIACLVIGMANPQMGTKMEEVKRKGVDIIIALDVSNSMLAEDLSPNRLGRAKLAIQKLIRDLHNDRLGLIVFAGDAYVQLPVTTDYSAAKLFLETVDTDVVPTQGTAIGTAIEMSMESFNFEGPQGKAIIVITDGENHEDDAVKAAEAAAEKGVVVHTIGMGSESGAPIPVYRNGKQVGFKKDNKGESVVSHLNQKMLQQIASAGNGSYVRASNSSTGLQSILAEINKMEKKEFGSKVYKDYEDRFQIFIGASIFFLLINFMITKRKRNRLEKLNLFESE